ncbi:hypothetical protein [Rhodopseudomonas palustris]|uniref:Uncharacterized protein n=1 Tax=Rhodopseudomonas palustris (strain BisB18) TaxID=316056 RepID=Q21DA4_RHOPB
MGELYDWLIDQHHGLRTYKALYQKAHQLAQSAPRHRALYRMLALVVSDHIDAFDEQPVPTALAEAAFHRLLGVVAAAENSLHAPDSEQIVTLNRIAEERLF